MKKLYFIASIISLMLVFTALLTKTPEFLYSVVGTIGFAVAAYMQKGELTRRWTFMAIYWVVTFSCLLLCAYFLRILEIERIKAGLFLIFLVIATLLTGWSCYHIVGEDKR